MCAAAREQAAVLFRAIDADGSGTIDAAELAVAQRALLDIMPVDTWDFKSWDADRDGAVDMEDWMQEVHSIYGTVGSREFQAACTASLAALGVEPAARPANAAAAAARGEGEARTWRFGPIAGQGVVWTEGRPDDLQVDSHLRDCESLRPEARAIATTRMRALRAAIQLGAYQWDVNVRIVENPGADKVMLCMHGHGGNCNLGCWMQFWPEMIAHGYHVVAFDSPGYGRSSGMTNQTIKWKQHDQDLVLSLLRALGVPRDGGCVTTFGQCMGGAMFMRAFCKSPDTFGKFHVLHNATIGTWPAELADLLDSKGGGILVYWEADPDHMRESNVYKQFSSLSSSRPRVCRFFDLNGTNPAYRILSGGAICPGMSRAENSEVPGTGQMFYLMDPQPDCLEDTIRFATQAPRRSAAQMAAPAETALQRGVTNKTFRVFVRVRPPIAREAGLAFCVQSQPLPNWEPPEGWEGPPPDEVAVGKKRWVFDRVFSPEASQDDLFERAGQPIMDAVLSGMNGCLFAYGQTGSGKTFTMEGQSDPGLIPKMVQQLCSSLRGGELRTMYVQLYNDQLLDLFAPQEAALGIVDDPAFAGGALVTGATELTSRDPDELLARIRQGAEFRASGRTNMNGASSRSHAILTMNLTDPPRVFHLVDLAGSERVKKSGAEGARMDEAIAINSSLLALGNVVSALVEADGRPRAHIPYRDSILTRILRSALGGSGRTALVACVTPVVDSQDETINTLKFATRATFIRNEADKSGSEDEGAAQEDDGPGNVPQIDGDGEAYIPFRDTLISCYANWNAGRRAPLVVLLHHYGFGGSGYTMSHFWECTVAAGGRYLSPSFPGHGNTPGNSSSRPEDMAVKGGPLEILQALFDWTGDKKAILVGFDWGGGIALEFAMRYPARVQNLALWCASWRGDESRMAKLAQKKGKDILFLWDKNDPNRSEKKGRALAKSLNARYREFDFNLVTDKIGKWVRAAAAAA